MKFLGEFDSLGFPFVQEGCKSHDLLLISDGFCDESIRWNGMTQQ